MAKRKQLSWHAEQVKSQLLANDPTTCAQWGEYELSGSLADRMEEIVYNHGYEAASMLAAGDIARAKSTKARIEKEFWELAKHEGLVELLEVAWADGLAAGGGQENPAELLTLCSWCQGVIFDGPVGPQGEVSHGICYPCAVARADEYGLTDEDLEEMREEQGGAKKNPEGDLASVGARLKRWAQSEKGYVWLDKFMPWADSWVAGGCVPMVLALRQLWPEGQLVGIESEGVVHHVALLVGGRVLDGGGWRTPKSALNWWKVELPHPQLVPVTEAKVRNILRKSPELVDKLSSFVPSFAAHLRDVLA
jgi:hypothetical protein